ncbi:hypothetical protein HanPSC8_Chr02g0073781 [Helianthus annuus]|nr:hypothetical protein HanPSC8_Chr02g0073781 [Helianthus annuus]
MTTGIASGSVNLRLRDTGRWQPSLFSRAGLQNCCQKFPCWYGSILVIKKEIKWRSLYPDYYDTNTVKVNDAQLSTMKTL